ncbi:MAG: S8 family serine peptidase, partial [Tsuneonella sp.]
SPGSCANNSPSTTDGCVFADRDIANGIDRAVAAGATVINLSLGGDPPNSTLVAAVQRAAAAGSVIVVSAGNEGDGSDPAVDPNQPNPFATGVRSAGGGNVIIVGSVNESGAISDFSNRAGSQASYFLTAQGDRVCCVYENGVLKVESTPQGNFVTVISGTSFSAPQVAGAVALLKQAFPNLTGTQIVEILLSSARDAGASGTDTTYGRGILDIAAAFAPRGATTLAGSTAVVSLDDNTAIGSAPMGDAFARTAANTVILDSYGRAYGTDLARGMQAAAQAPRLLGAIEQRSHSIGGVTDSMSMAFTIADRTNGVGAWPAQLRLIQKDAEAARVLAGRAAVRLSPGKQLAFGFRERADGLVAQLQGQARPAFLIATDARGDMGFATRGDVSLAFRQQLGPWGLTASAERGEAWLGTLRLADGILGRRRETRDLASFSMTADRTFGAVDASAGLTWMTEDRTILGGYFHDAFGAGGANSVFMDMSAGWRIADGWRLGGAFRQGWTNAEAVGTISAGSRLVSRAWSADIARLGVLGRADSLSLRISQPLRVEGGGLELTLPVAYDYATLLPTYGVRTLELSPSGREIDGEIAWAGRLFGGSAAASLFYRKDPGHIARMPDDKGAAVKWSKRF